MPVIFLQLLTSADRDLKIEFAINMNWTFKAYWLEYHCFLGA